MGASQGVAARAAMSFREQTRWGADGWPKGHLRSCEKPRSGTRKSSGIHTRGRPRTPCGNHVDCHSAKSVLVWLLRLWHLLQGVGPCRRAVLPNDSPTTPQRLPNDSVNDSTNDCQRLGQRLPNDSRTTLERLSHDSVQRREQTTAPINAQDKSCHQSMKGHTRAPLALPS